MNNHRRLYYWIAVSSLHELLFSLRRLSQFLLHLTPRSISVFLVRLIFLRTAASSSAIIYSPFYIAWKFLARADFQRRRMLLETKWMQSVDITRRKPLKSW